MTEKEFLNKVTHSADDFLQKFLDLLRKNKVKFCAIGGLAVNAYADPVVSLDLDVVLATEKLDALMPELKKRFKVATFENSINVGEKKSDLRIQIQTDSRYQSFISRSKTRNVLGYKIPVAALEDVLQGKIWAAMDESRRPSKRQKDLADILRLIEEKKMLADFLPQQLKQRLGINHDAR